MGKTVIVAAPLCMPSRYEAYKVERVLAPYHFNLEGLSAAAGGSDPGGKPQHWEIRVTFSDAAARWGEYVLLRSGYPVLSKYVDPRNAAWAAHYAQVVPQGGWYAPGCKDKPKSQPGKAQPQGAMAENLPVKNPPTPWSTKPRDWWNHLRDGGRDKRGQQAPTQPQPKKRKKGFFDL